MNALLYGIAMAAVMASHAAVQASDVGVRVNGSIVRFQAAQPMPWYNRLLVPLKDVVEEMGGSTRWYSRTNTIKVTIGDRTAFVKVGSQVASLGDREIWLDVAPRTVHGTTLVPLSFFSDAFGADARWNSATRVATIDTSRRGSATTAALNESTSREQLIRPAESENDTARRNYRAQITDGADGRADAEYDRFLVEQDFRRYQNDRSRWIQDFQNYRAGLMLDGSRGNFQPSSDYAQYLRDRDFELFTNNLAAWRASYDRYIQWRRTVSTSTRSPRYEDYLRDRMNLAAQTDRLLRQGRTNAIPGTGRRASTPGTGTTSGPP